MLRPNRMTRHLMGLGEGPVNLLDPNSTTPAGYGVMAEDVPAASTSNDLSTVAPAPPSDDQAEPRFPWKAVGFASFGLMALVGLARRRSRRGALSGRSARK